MSSIPEEIQEDILLRLPVKSISRFKSVCKRWYTLIHNSKFVKDHLNHTSKYPSIMIRDTSCADGRESLYIADYDSISSAAASSSCKCEAVVRLNCPEPEKHNRYFDVWGSCNGLFCLGTRDSYYIEKSIIWNPSTREYKKIIPPRDSDDCDYDDCDCDDCDHEWSFYGFGYDSKNNDYKVVCISPEYEVYFEAYVYTLKSDSWRKVTKTIPYVRLNGPAGLFLNGALHWSLDTSNKEISNAIIAFDISNEKFTNLPFPEDIIRPAENQYCQLRVLGDSLCIVCYVLGVQVDVWIMQNYGVKESWTKRFTTTRKTITKIPSSLKLWRYLRNGDILIEASGRFAIYDQKNDKIRFLNINGLDDGRSYLVGESYVESLVSLNSGTYIRKRSELLMEDYTSNKRRRRR